MGRKKLHFEGDTCETDGCFNDVASVGQGRYRAVCNTCHKSEYSKPWLKFRKSECEECGHRSFFGRSLSVHHRDGDNSNNDPDNLTTLCTNCHMEIEGFIEDQDGDWEKAEKLFSRYIRTLF